MHDFNRITRQGSSSHGLTVTFLDHLCMALDLTKTQRTKAEDHYAAITKILSSEDSQLLQFSPLLHVQGSFLQKTMVKPMVGVGYDIDLICLLHNSRHLGPDRIFTIIVEALKSRYPDMEVKNRCCRINYSGEFHMDIIPASPEHDHDSTRILIPDRPRKKFLPSCPKPFASWFEDITHLKPKFSESLFESVINCSASSAVIEPLPDYDGMNQEPLRRFVQILKAARNHYYQDLSCKPPTSIVLTTLTAHAYKKAVLGTTFDSMLHVFRAVASDLHSYVEVGRDADGTLRLTLKNPQDDRENFLDSWENDEESLGHFNAWQREVVTFIDQMIQSEDASQGIDGAHKRLAHTFGEPAATAAVRRVATTRREDVLIGRAGFTSSGLLVPASAAGARPTPPQTFHGKSNP